MHLFRGCCENLMAVILCALLFKEVAVYSAASKDVFSERTIEIKMPGSRPLKVNRLVLIVFVSPDIFVVVH